MLNGFEILSRKVDTFSPLLWEWSNFASPKTEKDKDARALLQDKAGAGARISNPAEITVLQALHKLAEGYGIKGQWSYVRLCSCPYCRAQWLVCDPSGHAVHTCLELRKYSIPLLYTAHLENASTTAEVEEDRAEFQALPEGNVTRASYLGVLPWEFGESLAEDPQWVAVGGTTKRKRPKRTVTENDPIHIRALDFRGRITRHCFTILPFATAAQLLSHAAGSTLLGNGTPLPVQGIEFIKLSAVIVQSEEEIFKRSIQQSALNTAKSGPTVWLAVSEGVEEEARKKS